MTVDGTGGEGNVEKVVRTGLACGSRPNGGSGGGGELWSCGGGGIVWKERN